MSERLENDDSKIHLFLCGGGGDIFWGEEKETIPPPPPPVFFGGVASKGLILEASWSTKKMQNDFKVVCYSEGHPKVLAKSTLKA